MALDFCLDPGSEIDGFRILDADMIVTPCPVCQLNVEIYQGQINKRYGTKFKIPVVYYSQLMTVAYGGTAKGETGMSRVSTGHSRRRTGMPWVKPSFTKGPADLWPAERARQDAEPWLSSEAGQRSDERHTQGFQAEQDSVVQKAGRDGNIIRG